LLFPKKVLSGHCSQSAFWLLPI